MNLSGVLVAATTPFDPVSGDVDIVGLRANVRHWIDRSVRGVVIGGSTGEAVYLDSDERHRLLEAARGVIPDDRLLVAGTGAESTRGTLALCRSAAEAGADAVLVMPPAFYKGAMSPEALALHYRRVADECPLPVILYQVPPHLGTIELPTGLVADLSAHPNIVGIKDSRGSLELLADLVEHCQEGFQVLVGSGSQFYACLEVGAVGGILGVANLMPAETAELVQAWQQGRGTEAGRLQELVGPVHKAIVGGMGVSGVKAALDLLGLKGGVPRPPLLPLAEKRHGELKAALDAAGLLQGTRMAESRVGV
jgi:4-hydroxy-2-oxoglutarate aldolase